MVVLVVLIVVIICFYLFVFIFVDGILMMFIFYSDDCVIINCFGNVDCFDVIVFWELDGKEYIKWVIGLLGDIVEYKED